MPSKIMDWKTFRDMALELTKKGYIPIYGEFCPELEEIVVECIHMAQKSSNGRPLTLLINSNGGLNDCFTGIWAAMHLSGLEFVGIVTGRARSNGFRILQRCTTRKAIANSQLVFHWGQHRFENSQLDALLEGELWVVEHVRANLTTMLHEVHKRTGVPIKLLCKYARQEREFSAHEALATGFVDEVIMEIPVSLKELALTISEIPENVHVIENTEELKPAKSTKKASRG